MERRKVCTKESTEGHERKKLCWDTGVSPTTLPYLPNFFPQIEVWETFLSDRQSFGKSLTRYLTYLLK